MFENGKYQVPVIWKEPGNEHPNNCDITLRRRNHLQKRSQKNPELLNLKTLKKKTLWPLFMDRVQLPQGLSHFEEVVYFLPLSSQKFLVLILPTSKG